MADEQAKKPAGDAVDAAQARRRVRARQPTIIGTPVVLPSADANKPPASPAHASAAEPAASSPAASKPAASKPAASKPAASKPAASKPAASKPAASKPAASSNAAASKPAASSNAAASKPAASSPPKASVAKRTPGPLPSASLPRPKAASSTEARAAPGARAAPPRASAPKPTPAPIEAETPREEAALRPSDPPELEGPPTQVGGAAPPIEELEGPPTQVGASPGFAGPAAASSGFAGPSAVEPIPPPEEERGAETDPALEPPEDLPFEPTMPAVKASPPPPEEPERQSTEPRDLIVEPTVVVHPSITQADQAQQPTYRVDVDSGLVQLETAELEPATTKRGPGPFIALGVLVGLLVLGGGGAVAYVLLAPSDEVSEPATAASEPAPTEEPTVEPAIAQQDVEPAAVEAPAEASAPEDVEDVEDDIEDDGADEPAPAVGQVVARAELEGFEVPRPRLSRRARRMSAAARRRQAVRLRSAALRAYREGDYARSEASFRDALEHVPGDGAAMEGLARATAQQSRLPEALAWANLAVERNPRSGAAYRVLGDVWRQAGHPDEAARVYRRGLFREPRDRWLRQRLRDVQRE